MEASGAASSDWRSHLPPEARARVIKKIMGSLEKHLPKYGQENLGELRKIAIRFEEKIFTVATNQTDYLKKISMKMLSMESKSHNTDYSNQMASNSSDLNSTDGSHVLQQHLQNTGQSLQMPLPNQGQTGQKPLSSGIQNNLSSTMAQGSAGLSTMAPSVNGHPQSVPSNIKTLNLQSMPAISQNAFNSTGKGMSSNIHANSERQMQGNSLQQPLIPQLQLQNSHLYSHQVQQPEQIMKSKIQLNSLSQSQMMQQQSLLSTCQTSNLQSSQPSLQQGQSAILHHQSQSNGTHQSSLGITQKHPQTVFRQQQSQTSLGLFQASCLQQQQQQQKLLSQRAQASSFQHAQHLSQQNSISDMQEQRKMSVHQGNLMGMQQPRPMLSQQATSQPQQVLPHLQQQSKKLGSQSNMKNIHQQHQVMNAMQQQHTPQQTSPAMVQAQGQQSQAQQHDMPPIQGQPVQLQQQGIPLQREMQQMQQKSPAQNVLLQEQNTYEKQIPLYQSQRRLSEVSPNSTESTGQTSQSDPDSLEETYQKIQSMKERYYVDIYELHQKIIQKMQQLNETLISPEKLAEQENYKRLKDGLAQVLTLFRLSKTNIPSHLKEKLPSLERQICNTIESHRRKLICQQSQSQQQLTHPNGDFQSVPVQPSSPAPVQKHEAHIQSIPSSVGSTMQNMTMSYPTHPQTIPSASQNIMSKLQSGPAARDSMQDGGLSGLESFHQSTFSSSSESSMHQLGHPNTFNPLQQYVKQEQNSYPQLMQSQQMKQQIQQQQKPIQPQFVQRQLPKQQLHQMNEMSSMKLKQGATKKTELFQPNFSEGTLQPNHHQLKPGQTTSAFLVSSPPSMQALSPQISQLSSSQIDQSPFASVRKAATPLRSSNTPFLSAFTPPVQSPLRGDHEKQMSGFPSTGLNVGLQQVIFAPPQVQSSNVGTPGISPSPLLADYISPDNGQATVVTITPSKVNATEKPINRLLKVMQSLSQTALSSSLNDIGSVLSMSDRKAGSGPGNGSRAAIGEDLSAMTKCRLQARSFMSSNDASGSARKLKRYADDMPLFATSSVASMNIEEAELVPTATSKNKKVKSEVRALLLEEIREINQQLIDTVVDIAVEVGTALEGGHGTVVKCSYRAVALSSDLKSHLASKQMFSISPLQLLVPSTYPLSSPVLLDNIPIDDSEESADLSAKAKSRFCTSLRCFTQPISLNQMVSIWETCIRKVIEDYASKLGGGTFTSAYGTWENCVAA